MLKRLSPRHLEIIRNLAMGLSEKEVAEELGISPVGISRLRRDPLFESELKKLQKEIRDRTIDSCTKAMETLKGATEYAAEICVNSVRGELDGELIPVHLRLKTAWDILNQTGVKIPEKKFIGHADVTEVLLSAYRRRVGDRESA